MALAKKIRSLQITGSTIYAMIRREVDEYLLNDADGGFASGPSDPYISLAENATLKGLYEVSENRAVWSDGSYLVVVYAQAGDSPSPVADTVVEAKLLSVRSDVILELSDVGTLLDRLTSARAGYLDELATLPSDVDTLLARLTSARAGYLDELATLPSDVDTLLDRLTAIRAANLDYIGMQVVTPVQPTAAAAAGDMTTGLYSYAVSALSAWGETLTSVVRTVSVARLDTPTPGTFVAIAGTLAAATYYYRVSAINAVGETLANIETSQVLGATGGVRVTWSAVTGSTGYKIYGRTTGAELLMATVGTVTEWEDDGSVTPSGALPTDHTATGIELSWPAVNNTTGYRVYGRSGDILKMAETTSLSWIDDGSVTPSGALPTENTVGLEAQMRDMWTAFNAAQAILDKLAFDPSDVLISTQQYPTGAVATDSMNSSTRFKTNLTESSDDALENMWVRMTSGDLLGQVQKVGTYTGSSKVVTTKSSFTGTPADGVTFELINR